MVVVLLKMNVSNNLLWWSYFKTCMVVKYDGDDLLPQIAALAFSFLGFLCSSAIVCCEIGLLLINVVNYLSIILMNVIEGSLLNTYQNGVFHML